ncbi:MAG TPA: glycoside hydrolase family 15 protein [Rugosibacter sp.]
MYAFGHPGTSPTWSRSAKDMVGCALGPARLWYTTGFGILNEVYYPRADLPQIRDLGFIIADGKGFWVEIKRLNNYKVRLPAFGVPAIEIVHEHECFTLRLRIAADPARDVVLIEVALEGESGLRPYALLAPHLGGSGNDNVAGIGSHHGRKVLWAKQGPFALALATVNAKQIDAWGASSVGYVGASDGWQDFARNGALTWNFDEAGPGNVALIGELPQKATLALAFGTSRRSAATLAFSSLCQPFQQIWDLNVVQWRDWSTKLSLPMGLPAELQDELLISAMMLRVHQDKTYPGAMVASLSIPWGNAHDDVGGYHLVWPRDLVESAGGLLALGACDEVRDILCYLIATQHAEGNWSQNQWLGGKPFWNVQQLDETAFPVLLAAALAERNELNGVEVGNMVRRALTFIVCHGPATEQDRWEEDAGVNAFTLAVCISALVCGVEWLDEPQRSFVLDLADYWNAHIEDWTAVRDTALAHTCGVDSYYIRIAPVVDLSNNGSLKYVLPLKNRACDPGLTADEQIGTDFLQLVRLGLRDAHDVLVVDSLKVVDHQLKVETSSGDAWHRYTGDGYGEHDDGSPFDGVGRGRAWPMLGGERGMYELVAGKDPLPYLQAMAVMAGPAGMLPEQVWDAEPIAQRGLFSGRPSGSAMPLVWAHAEFIKLARSRELKTPCDRPAAVWKRYQGRQPTIKRAIWMLRFPITLLPVGQELRICLPGPAQVHYGVNGWNGITDIETIDSGLGLYAADLPTAQLQAGQSIDFTFYWNTLQRWEGCDFHIEIVSAVT